MKRYETQLLTSISLPSFLVGKNIGKENHVKAHFTFAKKKAYL